MLYNIAQKLYWRAKKFAKQLAALLLTLSTDKHAKGKEP